MGLSLMGSKNGQVRYNKVGFEKRKWGLMILLVVRISGETGGSGERDVKNSGDLQRAKRMCGQRDTPGGKVGRG